jgi:transposase
VIIGILFWPAPVRIVEKGLATDRVVIDSVVSKYANHVPNYRRSFILERETGRELSGATSDGSGRLRFQSPHLLEKI